MPATTRDSAGICRGWLFPTESDDDASSAFSRQESIPRAAEDVFAYSTDFGSPFRRTTHPRAHPVTESPLGVWIPRGRESSPLWAKTYRVKRDLTGWQQLHALSPSCVVVLRRTTFPCCHQELVGPAD